MKSRKSGLFREVEGYQIGGRILPVRTRISSIEADLLRERGVDPATVAGYLFARYHLLQRRIGINGDRQASRAGLAMGKGEVAQISPKAPASNILEALPNFPPAREPLSGVPD